MPGEEVACSCILNFLHPLGEAFDLEQLFASGWSLWISPCRVPGKRWHSSMRGVKAPLLGHDGSEYVLLEVPVAGGAKMKWLPSAGELGVVTNR